jgi:dynein heavy chain
VLFGWFKTEFPRLADIGRRFEPYEQLWTETLAASEKLSAFMHGPLASIDANNLDKDVQNMWRALFKMSKKCSGTSAAATAEALMKRIDEFKPHVPLAAALCNPGLRDRHWREVADVIGFRLSLAEYGFHFSSFRVVVSFGSHAMRWQWDDAGTDAEPECATALEPARVH